MPTFRQPGCLTAMICIPPLETRGFASRPHERFAFDTSALASLTRSTAQGTLCNRLDTCSMQTRVRCRHAFDEDMCSMQTRVRCSHVLLPATVRGTMRRGGSAVLRRDGQPRAPHPTGASRRPTGIGGWGRARAGQRSRRPAGHRRRTAATIGAGESPQDRRRASTASLKPEGRGQPPVRRPRLAQDREPRAHVMAAASRRAVAGWRGAE